MARTNIVPNIAATAAPFALLTAYPTLPPAAGALNPTLTSTGDPTSRSTPLVDSKTMVLAVNSDTVTHSITITSVADSINRAGDITAFNLGVAGSTGAIALLGPFKAIGWAQAGNLLFIDVDSPKVQLSILQLT